jgi:hypothetical protein
VQKNRAYALSLFAGGVFGFVVDSHVLTVAAATGSSVLKARAS